jgi:DNA helicase-2/ATP-dependent DNA helicase PcrA
MSLQLSSEQRQIVESTAPAIVVTAGAGAGKTEVIANRVEHLISASEGEPYRILAVSYTVKAALELEERLRARVHDFRRVDAETIHSFAHRLIRQHGTWEDLPAEPEVLDRDEDRVELLTMWLSDVGEQIDGAEARRLLADIDLGRATRTEAPYLAEYREALSARQALDFPAMLEVAARLLEREWLRDQLAEVYRHLIVDEAQNLTAAQYELISLILGEPPSPISSMFVGDAKQSIVQFAGADPGLMNRYEHEFSAERMVLTQNFRSAAAIVRLTERVAASLSESVTSEITSAVEGLVAVHEYSDEESEGRATAEWVNDLLENGLPREAVVHGEDPYLSPESIGRMSR